MSGARERAVAAAGIVARQLLAIAGSLAVVAGSLALLGYEPGPALGALVWGAVGTSAAWTATALKADAVDAASYGRVGAKTVWPCAPPFCWPVALNGAGGSAAAAAACFAGSDGLARDLSQPLPPETLRFKYAEVEVAAAGAFARPVAGVPRFMEMFSILLLFK